MHSNCSANCSMCLLCGTVILENSPRDDSGIVAVQPSGYVSGSFNTVHVQDTQSWPQDPPTQSAPEIEVQISSVHSTQSGLQGNKSKRAAVRGANTRQPKYHSMRTTESCWSIHSFITDKHFV